MSSFHAAAQGATVYGSVTSSEGPVPFANVYFKENQQGTATDESGNFRLQSVKPGRYQLRVSAVGFSSLSRNIVVQVNFSEPVNPVTISGKTSITAGGYDNIRTSYSYIDNVEEPDSISSVP